MSESSESPEISRRRLPQSMSVKSTSPGDNLDEDDGAISLSEAQMKVMHLIMSRKNCFFTGAAGTGKSYCVSVLQDVLAALGKTDVIALTAPTGVAACNIKGMTIHSWSGCGLGTDPIDKIVSKLEGFSKRAGGNDTPKERWRKSEILVIDEISMLSANLFNKIDEIGRRMREVDNKPFGGIQVILCGDFFQLPPVGAGAESKFCFESPVWDELLGGKDGMIVLDKVFRQKDGPFVRILNDMRRGIVGAEARQILTEKVRHTEKAKQQERAQEAFALQHGRQHSSTPVQASIKATILFSRNNDCDRYNQTELEKLPKINVNESGQIMKSEDGEEYIYDAVEQGDEHQLKGFKVPKKLELRVGSQVMLLKNLEVTAGLVNGTRGVIKRFVDPCENAGVVDEGTRAGLYFAGKPLPEVEFHVMLGSEKSTVRRTLKNEIWEVMSGEKVVASRSQIPLMLAWAISVHKSQGMTIPYLEMGFEGIFEYGQAYVAISRATNLPGLSLRSFTPNAVKVHPRVVEFYTGMGCNLDETEQISENNVTTTIKELCSKFKELPGGVLSSKKNNYSRDADADGWVGAPKKRGQKKGVALSGKGIAAAFTTQLKKQGKDQGNNQLSSRLGSTVAGGAENVSGRVMKAYDPKASNVKPSPSGHIFGAFAYQEHISGSGGGSGKEKKSSNSNSITNLVRPPTGGAGGGGGGGSEGKYHSRYSSQPHSSTETQGQGQAQGQAHGSVTAGSNSNVGKFGTMKGGIINKSSSAYQGKEQIQQQQPCEMHLTATCADGESCQFDHDMHRVEDHYNRFRGSHGLKPQTVPYSQDGTITAEQRMMLQENKARALARQQNPSPLQAAAAGARAVTAIDLTDDQPIAVGISGSGSGGHSTVGKKTNSNLTMEQLERIERNKEAAKRRRLEKQTSSQEGRQEAEGVFAGLI